MTIDFDNFEGLDRLIGAVQRGEMTPDEARKFARDSVLWASREAATALDDAARQRDAAIRDVGLTDFQLAAQALSRSKSLSSSAGSLWPSVRSAYPSLFRGAAGFGGWPAGLAAAVLAGRAWPRSRSSPSAAGRTDAAAALPSRK